MSYQTESLTANLTYKFDFRVQYVYAFASRWGGRISFAANIKKDASPVAAKITLVVQIKKDDSMGLGNVENDVRHRGLGPISH